MQQAEGGLNPPVKTLVLWGEEMRCTARRGVGGIWRPTEERRNARGNASRGEGIDCGSTFPFPGSVGVEEATKSGLEYLHLALFP